MIISLLVGQDPKKKKTNPKPDKVKVDTSVTVTRKPQVDSIQMEQKKQMRELDKRIKEAKKK